MLVPRTTAPEKGADVKVLGMYRLVLSASWMLFWFLVM